MTILRDLRSNIDAKESVRPQVATATVAGQTVDTRGYSSASLHLQTGAVAGAADFTAALQESDESASGFTDVAADDLIGAGTVPATLAANSVYRVGYKGNKRYLRANLTHNGGTSLAVAASILLGNADQRPVA
jgi:hypothetical protein